MKEIFYNNPKNNYSDPLGPRFFHCDPSCAHPNNNNTFKIVTYNIRFSLKVPQAIHLIQSNPNLNHADIFCAQEMTPDAVHQIAQAFKYNYIYYPSVIHPQIKKDFGNAIFTHWPILHDRKIILTSPRPSTMQRIAVVATLNIHQKPVTIVCVHMEVLLNSIHRKKQIKQIIDNLPPSPTHCLIAGDFNTLYLKSQQVVMDSFQKNHFQLATETSGWTFKHWCLLNKKIKLDYIFSKNLTVKQMGKVMDQAISDHLPVWAEFSFDGADTS